MELLRLKDLKKVERPKRLDIVGVKERRFPDTIRVKEWGLSGAIDVEKQELLDTPRAKEWRLPGFLEPKHYLL